MLLCAAANEWVWLHSCVGAEQPAQVTTPQSSASWPLAEKRKFQDSGVGAWVTPPPSLSINTTLVLKRSG